jgi:hypothetical protein
MRILFVCTVLFFSIQANSQLIEGHISDTSGLPLSFVHIINMHSRQGVISDNDGCFSIPAQFGDTLYVSALGFKNKMVRVETLKNITIIMSVSSVAIEDVEIYPYKTYADFKYAFLNLDLEDERLIIDGVPNKMPPEVPMFENKEYISSVGFLLSSPISYMYYNLSKTEQDKRRAHELKGEAKQVRVIDKKFNIDLVSTITGENDTTILVDFIAWCKFDQSFLLKSNAYTIATAVWSRWEAYCREHKLTSC